MEDFQAIVTEERQDGIGIITLNRPEKRNALSIRMRKEISACLGRWEGNEDIGAVIITGEGRTFSAGFDLDEFGRPDVFEDLFNSSSRYHRDLWHFPKPVIAAVNGAAMGGGFDLAVFCDIRLCSATASFGHPEIKFGAPPIFTPLQRIVGEGWARDLCLTGRRIDAKEAHRIALVSEVVEEDELLARALRMAATVLEAPPHALQFAKGFFTSADKGFEKFFALEHDRAFSEVILKRFAKQ